VAVLDPHVPFEDIFIACRRVNVRRQVAVIRIAKQSSDSVFTGVLAVLQPHKFAVGYADYRIVGSYSVACCSYWIRSVIVI